MAMESPSEQESVERSSLKRSNSGHFETEASAAPPLTYRPKPAFGADNSSVCSSFSSFSASSSNMTAAHGHGGKYGPFSSSPLSSSGKSSNSSPSMTWSSPQGSFCASTNGGADRENCSTCPNQTGLSKVQLSVSVDERAEPDVRRVTSWSQYLDFGEAHPATAESNHMVDMSQLFLGQKFACGAFSRIYRGQYREQEVAVKLVRQPDDDEEMANRLDRQFHQEVSLLCRLHHVNVVQFVGAMRKPPVFCIVTEYLVGGSLRAFLHKNQPHGLPIDMVLAFAIDIARGMEYLHSQGVLHLDLKSHNLVLGENWRVKVTDFGVARLQSECASMTPDSGTYRWMAPEMISNKTFSMKADVYSFGVILWEIFTGQTPYEEMSVIQAAFAVVDKNVRPKIPDNCPRPLKQLMEECWAANPDKRPSFWQITQRLDEFQECVKRHEAIRSRQLECEKKNWLLPLLNKFKPMCFAAN